MTTTSKTSGIQLREQPNLWYRKGHQHRKSVQWSKKKGSPNLGKDMGQEALNPNIYDQLKTSVHYIRVKISGFKWKHNRTSGIQ
jgi:hypothetical protein